MQSERGIFRVMHVPRRLCPLALLWTLTLGACAGKGEDADDDGYAIGWDCDDRDSRINPDAAELCDGIDNDCDGFTDGEHAEDATTWYIDYDGDGYGTNLYTRVECERPDGYESRSDDCDDTDPTVHPGTDELCDFQDGDCDGSVDEDAADATTWYMDGDHDGYGATGVTFVSCVQPSGYTSRSTDCDDADASVHAGAEERCNDKDDDCDGRLDEDAADAPSWYGDADGDGYGDPEVHEESCTQPDGMVAEGTDCHDGAPDISPAEEEICEDGKDNDCDETDNGCAPNGAWTLDEADVWLFGSASYDNAGAAVAPVGDVDGDGFAELMVGVPGSDVRAENGGLVAILEGPLDAEEELDNAPVLLYGAQSGDGAGDALAPAGDLDGDGISDLLVGAPGADTSAEDAGIAYVLAGPLTASLRLSSADGRLKGYGEGDEVGRALSGVGDLDEDGYGDLLVGAPGRDDESEDAGAAFLVSGPVDGAEDLEERGVALYGYGERASAGRSVSGAGDTDGDGVPDLIVGVPGDEAGGSWAGAAYLVSGPVSAALLLTHEGVALRGEAEGDAAGWSVCGLGDMDEDGYDDVAVGAYGGEGDAGDSGLVYVVRGPVGAMLDLSAADARLRGRETRGYAGWTVAGVGDINGDGAADLGVGARGSDGGATDGGAAYLLYGPLSGGDGLDGADAVFYGTSAGDLAGTAVSGAGDVDGDGFLDLLMGGPAADGAETSSGAAWVVLGSGM